jgi:Co/Zn/Cd efflux system component
MADSCCENKGDELVALRERQGRVLWIVLAINAVLFVVEFGVGWVARSTALLGDSLDMLGDALVYAFSIWVLHRGSRWRARASLSKGIVQLAFGLLVLGQAIGKLVTGLDVDAAAMGWMGAIALAGNGYCFYLLWSHRSDDLNMASTWLCSRNDLIANTGVLAAAALVALTGSGVPDIVVGLAVAALFIRTAWQVIGASRRELEAAPSTATVAPASPERV